MGHNDHFDDELYAALQSALEEGLLDSERDRDALGVSRQVTSQGYDSLTPNQRRLYDTVIVPALIASAERQKAKR